MEGIKFFHYREIDVVYTAYKVPFDGREIYVIAWHGKRQIETVTYEIDEVESNFKEGIWVKVV